MAYNVRRSARPPALAANRPGRVIHRDGVGGPLTASRARRASSSDFCATMVCPAAPPTCARRATAGAAAGGGDSRRQRRRRRREWRRECRREYGGGALQTRLQEEAAVRGRVHPVDARRRRRVVIRGFPVADPVFDDAGLGRDVVADVLREDVLELRGWRGCGEGLGAGKTGNTSSRGRQRGRRRALK